MSVGAPPESEVQTPSQSSTRPAISACESSPGKVVFIEASNTDGWIASDTTVELER